MLICAAPLCFVLAGLGIHAQGLSGASGSTTLSDGARLPQPIAESATRTGLGAQGAGRSAGNPSLSDGEWALHKCREQQWRWAGIGAGTGGIAGFVVAKYRGRNVPPPNLESPGSPAPPGTRQLRREEWQFTLMGAISGALLGWLISPSCTH